MSIGSPPGMTGDRPNFPLTNERLDKVDLVAIAEYLNRTITRTNSGILGPGSGLLTTCSFDTSLAPVVTVGPCLLAYGTATDATTADDGLAAVVVHDPTRSSMLSSDIDLTAFVGVQTWLWFTRYEASTATDTRRQWTAGSEVSASAETLLQEGVLFTATEVVGGDPSISEANGYFRFAVVTSWAGSVPTIRPLFWPDGADGWATADGTLADFSAGPNSGGSVGGLSNQLRWIFNKLTQHIDSDWAFDAATTEATATGAYGWTDTPLRGLNQLSTALATAEADIATLQTSVAGPRVLATIRVLYSSGPATYSIDAASYVTGVSAPAVTTVAFGTGRQAQVTFTTSASIVGYNVSCEQLEDSGVGPVYLTMPASLASSPSPNDYEFHVWFRSAFGNLVTGSNFYLTVFGAE